MHDVYSFVSGPLAWIAFILFVGGCLYRIIYMLYMVYQKEKFIFSYMSWKYSFRSIFRWLIPFATVNWRNRPLLTVVTFAFHICLIITPIFLLSHVVLWEESWNISWWTLPDSVSDIMTLIVIFGCVYFLIRRLISPEVQFVTSASDYIILGIVAAPFVSGFMAYHQWFGHQFFSIFHIISGEVMLVAIPFTRLSHMVFAPFTRAYMGSEFGKVRHAQDW